MNLGGIRRERGKGLRPLRDWRQLLIDIINWSAVDRGMLPLVLGTPLYLQVILWFEYVLQRADRDQLVNVAFGLQARGVFWAMTAGALALFALGFRLRKRHPDAAWYQYVTTLYYALTMSYCSWLVGTQSFMTGVVMLGAPVAGFILLERAPVLLAFLTALSCSMALSLASATGALPYAPLVIPPAGESSALFWAVSSYFLSLIPIVVLVVLADRALSSWRQREAGIHAISRTDALTGIHNRRSILELLDKEIARTRRHGPPLSVVILDLDHFKSVNDTWGHPTGDHVLQTTAEVLQKTIRQCDAVGRYGGEEFLILLPDTTLEGARVLADRCRQRLAEERVTAENGELFHVTGSFGLACNEQCFELGAAVLIKAADEALYRAKHAGRNRVEVVAPPPPATTV
jgi:diguanylate cyclase (GGDEF)-like protein